MGIAARGVPAGYTAGLCCNLDIIISDYPTRIGGPSPCARVSAHAAAAIDVDGGRRGGQVGAARTCEAEAREAAERPQEDAGGGGPTGRGPLSGCA
jgi:hypothetical protein